LIVKLRQTGLMCLFVKLHIMHMPRWSCGEQNHHNMLVLLKAQVHQLLLTVHACCSVFARERYIIEQTRL
jgi:hypothetical protein